MLADLPPADDPDAAPELVCERLATHDRDATANTAGVTLARLRENAAAAVEACRKAAAAHPEMPHYTALLARATYAEGDLAEAVRLYRDASARGDLRAATSLGLLIEHGERRAQGPPGGRRALREGGGGRPPRRGHQPRGDADQGRGRAAGRRPRHPSSSTRASEDGSAIATYNLGVLALNGVAGTATEAFDHFTTAARLGEPLGYQAAALLLDQGLGRPRDPDAAADLLLRGVASDNGQAWSRHHRRQASRSRPTPSAPSRPACASAGFYDGAIDGLSGPRLRAALTAWRKGGFLMAGG